MERLGYGQMPPKALIEALDRETSGRILRVENERPDDKPPGTWTRAGARARISKRKINVGKPEDRAARALHGSRHPRPLTATVPLGRLSCPRTTQAKKTPSTPRVRCSRLSQCE